MAANRIGDERLFIFISIESKEADYCLFFICRTTMIENGFIIVDFLSKYAKKGTF